MGVNAIPVAGICVLAPAAGPALAQVELSGAYSDRMYEDYIERGPGEFAVTQMPVLRLVAPRIPGQNPEADFMTRMFNLPTEAAMGYAETLYPEYRRKIRPTCKPPAECGSRAPGYCCGWSERQGRPGGAPNLTVQRRRLWHSRPTRPQTCEHLQPVGLVRETDPGRASSAPTHRCRGRPWSARDANSLPRRVLSAGPKPASSSSWR